MANCSKCLRFYIGSPFKSAYLKKCTLNYVQFSIGISKNALISEGFSHGAWDRLRYFIVALPWPFIYIFFSFKRGNLHIDLNSFTI